MDREARWARAAARRGSQAAAEKLVRAHYDEIYLFAYRQTGSKEDALDLTQTVFAAALCALPRYDHRKASFRTWLYRIAAHKVIDLRRRTAGTALVPLDSAEPANDALAEDDFSARVLDRALIAQIEAHVSRFDERAQAAFRLRLFAEKTFPEIAAILEEPEAAVKARYYRLLAKVRKEFEIDG